jgi:hypothetical protein
VNGLKQKKYKETKQNEKFLKMKRKKIKGQGTKRRKIRFSNPGLSINYQIEKKIISNMFIWHINKSTTRAAQIDLDFDRGCI